MTNCHQLKLPAADGKRYKTDAATPQILLRLIQSVPSPKAESIRKGGAIAQKARLELESKTGKSVVTGDNFLPPEKQVEKLKKSKK